MFPKSNLKTFSTSLSANICWKVFYFRPSFHWLTVLCNWKRGGGLEQLAVFICGKQLFSSDHCVCCCSWFLGLPKITVYCCSWFLGLPKFSVYCCSWFLGLPKIIVCCCSWFLCLPKISVWCCSLILA